MVEHYGTVRKFAAAIGLDASTVQRWIKDRAYYQQTNIGSARRMEVRAHLEAAIEALQGQSGDFRQGARLDW